MKEALAHDADAWEQLCIEHFQFCSVDWAAAAFDAKMRVTTTLHDTTIVQLTSSAFNVSRTPAHVRRFESDSYMFVTQQAGAPTEVEQFGQRTTIGRGQSILIDTASPYLFHLTPGVQQTVVSLPRDAVPRYFADSAGRALGSQEGATMRVFGAIVDELIGLDRADGVAEPADEADALIAVAIQLVGQRLRSSVPSARDLSRAGLLASAFDLVAAHYSDPGLDPATLAQHLHISTRYLSAIFTDAGTTPAGHIREQRLMAAATLLRSERHRMGILEIAARVGFADATTFARAFRRRFGTVPSDYRAQSLPRPVQGRSLVSASH